MHQFAKWLLKRMGWVINGELPNLDKYIIIVAPHTSNWDFVICMTARVALKLKIKFLAKHPLFYFPFGILMRSFGGLPVHRDRHENLVDAVIELFNQQQKLVLAIAPEGTRSPVKRWKQGFYHIAIGVKVPIVMIGPDYKSKQLRISPNFYPTGNIEQDFEHILSFFKEIAGRYSKKIPPYSKK